jgi:diadenosine tetraphosphate (Ap4A) HIT family hydrolase
MSGRRNNSEVAYQQAKIDQTTLPLHEEPSLKSWEHWRLIANRFPYDIIYKDHKMLLPIRQVSSWSDLTEDEQAEFWLIIDTFVEPDYDLWFVNTNKRRSILSHFHVHLATYYDKRDEMRLV